EGRTHFHVDAYWDDRACGRIVRVLPKVEGSEDCVGSSEMNAWIEGPPPREERGMGCVVKGCLILACFIVFLIIAGAIGVYFGTRTYSAFLHGFSWANKTYVLAQDPSPVPQS